MPFPEKVTQEYAESYQWWAEFLTARTNAIASMLKLGKPLDEILRTLNLEDLAHLDRIIHINRFEV